MRLAGFIEGDAGDPNDARCDRNVDDRAGGRGTEAAAAVAKWIASDRDDWSEERRSSGRGMTKYFDRQRDVEASIADTLRDFEKLVRQEDLGTLGYLLQMARLEARLMRQPRRSVCRSAATRLRQSTRSIKRMPLSSQNGAAFLCRPTFRRFKTQAALGASTPFE